VETGASGPRGNDAQERALVLIGDVVRSRRGPAAAGAWLRRLTAELDAAYGSEAIAPFAFTQGDELQGLIATEADPVRAVLISALHPDRQRMRWVVAAGTVVAGEGRATERIGEAFYAARALIEASAKSRDGLAMRTGDERVDRLLADLAPLLSELLDDLTARQREVARLALVEHLRQADVADRLDVSRASVSVTWGRGRVRSIDRLARALRTIFREGTASAGAGS
jgi:DNA-directed RNA polymerase specialized sigma24 family protein